MDKWLTEFKQLVPNYRHPLRPNNTTLRWRNGRKYLLVTFEGNTPIHAEWGIPDVTLNIISPPTPMNVSKWWEWLTK